MAYTLGDLIRDVYIEIGEMEVSSATTGTTTTVGDTKLSGGDIEDDDYKDGTLFIVEDAAGANGAPEDQFQRISGNSDNGTTQTFTVDTAFTTAPASGDIFGYARPTYPMRQTVEQINAALRMLGDLVLVDTSTLTTAAAQSEYTWSVAWKRRPPFRIDFQGKTNDSNDNRWIELQGWEVIPATAGSTGLIVFQGQLVTGRSLRVWYLSPHPRVNSYDDNIHASIHPELAVKASILKLAEWNIRRTGSDDIDARNFVNDAKREYEIAMLTYPIRQIQKDVKGGLVVSDVQTRDMFKDPAGGIW